MHSPYHVAAAAESPVGSFPSSLPQTPTSAAFQHLQQQQARRSPITPAQLEAAYARITPTRIGKPPVRLPLPVPKKPAEPEPKSPLELRPPWNGDFHVDRKDFSKPKPGQPLPQSQPLRMEYWGSPLAAAAAAAEANSGGSVHDGFGGSGVWGVRSGGGGGSAVMSPSKLPQPRPGHVESSMLRSRSMMSMKAMAASETPMTANSATATAATTAPPSMPMSPTPAAAGSAPQLRTIDPTAESLKAEVEAARKRIRELGKPGCVRLIYVRCAGANMFFFLLTIESQLAEEQQRRKDAEREYMKNEAEILKAWESEFDQRTALTHELETSQTLFAEVRQSVTELAIELDTIRDDLQIVESVLTDEQRQIVSAELARRAAESEDAGADAHAANGRRADGDEDGDEIDALRRRLEGLRNEL
ncbi:hypothetical protein BDZ88DRAFT_506554 [Geranomyces variabilis]|nr:hypothetical protein BDZ88DRAFT_506554 [Geranomyces variabilis]